jgi:hypothetical protein
VPRSIDSTPTQIIASGPGLGKVAAVVFPGNGLWPPAPNNDNTSISPNRVDVQKWFDHLDYIDMTFDVYNSGGTTEYFFDELSENQTGIDWLGYTFELGYSFDGAFFPSSQSDFLDFDVWFRDPAPTTSHFASVYHEPNEIKWYNGLAPAGVEVLFRFSVDVPDVSGAIPPPVWIVDADGKPIGYRITLRQTPRDVPFAPFPPPQPLVFIPHGIPIKPPPLPVGPNPPIIPVPQPDWFVETSVNVPEPGSFLLLLSGAAVLLRRRQ